MKNGPTRIPHSSKTQIDLIFSNKPERITKSFNFITGISDHNQTLITRKLIKNRIMYRQDKKHVSYRIPKKYLAKFEEELKQTNCSDLLASEDLDE